MVQSLFVRPLTDDETRELTAKTQSANKEEARRAELLLLSAGSKTSPQIAGILGFHPSNVKKWIRKFNQEGLPGIEVRKRGPREGRRPTFSRDQVDKVLDLASTEPGSLGLGFKRWTAQKLATAAAELGIVERISHVTVQQILKRNSDRLNQPGSAGATPLSPPQRGARAQAGSLAQGRKALSESRFTEAAQLLHSALNQPSLTSEEEAEIRSLLSQALEELGRYEESHAVVEKYEDHRLYSTLPPSSKARVKLRLGWVHSSLGNHPQAIAASNEAKKLFLELQDEVGLCEARLALGRTYLQLNEPRIAREHLLEAAAYQGRADDRELMARIYVRLGSVDFYEGAFKSSRENCLKALEFADGSANANILGLVYLNLGTATDEDNPQEREESAGYSRRAIECLGQGGHKGYLALAYNNLGYVLRFSGQWEQALECLNKAIEIAMRYDQTGHEATGRQTLADVLCSMGRYREAEEHLNRCIELAEKDSDKWLEGYAIRILAAIQIGRGQVDSALAGLRHSLRLSTSVGDIDGIILAELALAEAHLKQGGYEQAREYVEVAQGRYRDDKSKSLFVSGMLQRAAGEIETASGHFTKAKQHLAQSLSIFATTAVPYEAAKSHYAMGRLLAAAGDNAAAETQLLLARDIFESLGAAPGIELASNALAGLKGQGGGPADTPTNGASAYVNGAPGSVQRTNAAGKSDHAALAGSASDALLMQRLIDACASRELLLRELAMIIHESFMVDIAMICRLSESGQAEPIASEGLTLTEAGHLCAELDPAFLKQGGSRQGTYLMHIGSPDGNGFNKHAAGSSVFVYVSAPSFDVERLQPLIRQAELGLEMCSLRAAAAAAVSPQSGSEPRTREIMPGFIVSSPLMLDVIERIHKIRTSDVTVLITGESGTGKELVARAIHAESARASGIFLPFNCTATPRDLIDSQLFGHRRGSFTGAIGNYSGMVRAAEGGTLFLDEIGDLALEVQPKLMRFLQEGEIQPIGETRPVSVDVRVLAATNSDLERAVDEGRFREDLFHRLNIIRIHVPPLRERRDEVPALASFFLKHFASRSGRDGLAFTQDAVDALTQYDWPGNVRQLRNEIERVTAYASDARLVSSDDLSPEVRRAVQSPGFRVTRPPVTGLNQHQSRRPMDLLAPAQADRPHQPLLGGNGNAASCPKLKDAVAALETTLISEALVRNKNNISRTADDLGLSRRGLRLKLAQLGIDRQ